MYANLSFILSMANCTSLRTSSRLRNSKPLQLLRGRLKTAVSLHNYPLMERCRWPRGAARCNSRGPVWQLKILSVDTRRAVRILWSIPAIDFGEREPGRWSEIYNEPLSSRNTGSPRNVHGKDKGRLDDVYSGYLQNCRSYYADIRDSS